jgi:hypothetical protein
VRLPKGFGKNYFTLRAITATSNQVTLSANNARMQNFHMPRSTDSDENENEVEDPGLTVCEILSSAKPCHCNCYFLKKTRKILQLFPNQNYFFKYFQSLNNSISPPFPHAEQITFKN